MTRARNSQIDLGSTTFYHVINRCIRLPWDHKSPLWWIIGYATTLVGDEDSAITTLFRPLALALYKALSAVSK
jgi:hypothetical protein